MGARLVALSAASFGTMPIFAVWAYEDGASTWGLLTMRFGLAGLVLGAALGVRQIPLPPLRRCLPPAAMGVGYVGQSACSFTAPHYAQASLVSLLLYLFPAFFAVLAALFLGERLSVSVAVAIAISIAGTALLVGGGSGRALGMVLGVVAALIYWGGRPPGVGHPGTEPPRPGGGPRRAGPDAPAVRRRCSVRAGHRPRAAAPAR